MKKRFGHLASLILLVSSGVFGFDEQVIAVKDEGDFSTNWHQFRGPSASGVSSTAEPPTEWSETKNIKWKFDIEGVGSSTPIVWNNRVFFTSAIKTERVDPDLPAPEDQPRNGFFNIKAPNAFYQFVVFCVDPPLSDIVELQCGCDFFGLLFFFLSRMHSLMYYSLVYSLTYSLMYFLT